MTLDFRIVLGLPERAGSILGLGNLQKIVPLVFGCAKPKLPQNKPRQASKTKAARLADAVAIIQRAAGGARFKLVPVELILRDMLGTLPRQ